MKHDSVVNKLAELGLKVRAGVLENYFEVDTGEVKGSWRRDEKGNALWFSTLEHNRANRHESIAHGTFKVFLNHLTKDPNRKRKQKERHLKIAPQVPPSS